MIERKTATVGILYYQDGRRLVVVYDHFMAIDDFVLAQREKHGCIRHEEFVDCPVIGATSEQKMRFARMAERFVPGGPGYGWPQK